MASQTTSNAPVDDPVLPRSAPPLMGPTSVSRNGSTAAPDSVVILGVPFSPLDYEQAVERIRAMMGAPRAHHVVLANAHTMNCAYTDPAYRRILQRAALVLRDGVGLEVAGALAGCALRENFVGTDFVPYLVERLANPEVRVFLYGAEPGVADSAAAALVARHPGVRVVGVQHGYVNGDGTVEQIKAARPDVLLVALGNPLQERWIAEHLDLLGVPVAVGVGALFDYLAGRVPRAPLWVRRMRSEWLFRLAVEPKRLWRRYLIGNAQFLWRVLRSRASVNGHLA
jgi:N-acetylglucosaminyldiphosphoundecaprenol N-acetyl-beta-D-mannosaminyltransferase